MYTEYELLLINDEIIVPNLAKLFIVEENIRYAHWNSHYNAKGFLRTLRKGPTFFVESHCGQNVPEILKHFKVKDYQTCPMGNMHAHKNILNMQYYKTGVAEVVEYLEQDHADWFKTKMEALDIVTRADKKQRTRESSQRSATKKRALAFNWTEQCRIADAMVTDILKDNLILQLFQQTIKAEDVDLSGQKLYDSIGVFNIEPEILLKKWSSSEHPLLRRFAIAYSEEASTALGILDKDKLIREAAKQKIAKKKEKA